MFELTKSWWCIDRTYVKNQRDDKVRESSKPLGLFTGPNPSFFDDVVDFHKKFGVGYDGPPRTILPPDLDKFRRERLSAEFREYVDAKDAGQAAEMLDGLVDMIYIALGTCALHGWDFNEAWRRVHAANMAKRLQAAGETGEFQHKTNIVKPEGWVPPDLTDLVVEQGDISGYGRIPENE